MDKEENGRGGKKNLRKRQGTSIEKEKRHLAQKETRAREVKNERKKRGRSNEGKLGQLLRRGGQRRLYTLSDR